MMGSTPIDFRKARLRWLAVAATSAPFHSANCAANEPTPPLAPWMRKRIPRFAPAVSMMACQAVSAGIGSAAATLKSSERGFFTRSFTGTSAYSAKLPKTSPKTSSPSRNEVLEPVPIFSMTPAKSCPSVRGTRSAPFGLYWCSRTIQSTGLTPAARIRTSALPRVTLGVATSSSWTRSGPPNMWMRTAFMGLLHGGSGRLPKQPAQLLLGLRQLPLARCRQLAAGAVLVERQHRHGRAERSRLAPAAPLRRALQRARHLLGREVEDALPQVERVARLHDPLGPVAAGRALRRPAALRRALRRHA